jgi:hypothetical protein
VIFRRAIGPIEDAPPWQTGSAELLCFALVSTGSACWKKLNRARHNVRRAPLSSSTPLRTAQQQERKFPLSPFRCHILDVRHLVIKFADDAAHSSVLCRPARLPELPYSSDFADATIEA